MEFLPLIGRALFALTFIGAGIGHFAQGEAMATQARANQIPAPQLAVATSGLVLLAGGVLVMLGWQTQLGAGLIAGFLIIVSLTMHRFWSVTDAAEMSLQQAHFMKNLGLLGAALLVMYFGPGPYSLG